MCVGSRVDGPGRVRGGAAREGALRSASTDRPLIADARRTVNGVPHFYRMIGHGEPFVVLHGGPGMWHDELFPFFGDLATDHQVVFYDQRGNGKSLMGEITAENFTVDWLVSDLDELRTAWGFDRISIIGHSWGGLLAMYYAAKHPSRVRRLVLIDAAPVNTELLARSYDVLIERFTERDRNRLEEIYSSTSWGPSAARPSSCTATTTSSCATHRTWPAISSATHGSSSSPTAVTTRSSNSPAPSQQHSEHSSPKRGRAVDARF